MIVIAKPKNVTGNKKQNTEQACHQGLHSAVLLASTAMILPAGWSSHPKTSSILQKDSRHVPQCLVYEFLD